MVLTRNYLLKSVDGEHFETIQLPAPIGYVRKTGLFDTFWQLHSGELWGLPGKLIVDLLGLVTILLSITGLLHFFFPKIIRKRKKKEKAVGTLVSVKKKNLRWHNVVRLYFCIFPDDQYIFRNAFATSAADCNCQQTGRNYSRNASRQSKSPGSINFAGFNGTKNCKSIYFFHFRRFLFC